MGKLITRECQHCHKAFQTYDPTQRGCSRICGQRLRFDNTTARKQRTCQQCGTTYNATYAAQRTCTRTCGAALRQANGSYDPEYPPNKARRVEQSLRQRKHWPTCRVYWNQCEVCGKTFAARWRGRRACHVGHTDWEIRRVIYDRDRPTHTGPPIISQCKNCGATITETRGRERRWCSKRCCLQGHRRERRHILRARDGAERFTLHEIAERDRWRCHLCGKRVARKDASIDHLIPISAGGKHIRVNVALAHHLCNSRRSDKGPAQLLLIG